MENITINGLTLLIWFVALVVVGVTCYVWGRSDGREKEREFQQNLRKAIAGVDFGHTPAKVR